MSENDEKDIMNFTIERREGAGLKDYIQHFALFIKMHVW
jgi:hypothetical protein